MRLKVSFLLLIFIILFFSNLALGTGEKIPWGSINDGGNVYSSSTNYKQCGSVGQGVAGKSSYGLVAYIGFWNPWVQEITPVEWEEENAGLPQEFGLRQNYPNPFNPNTVIEYALPQEAHVSIVVYNLLGQKVRVLKDEIERAGFKRVIWDGKDDKGAEMASGIYFCRIQDKDFVKSKKMVLLK